MSLSLWSFHHLSVFTLFLYRVLNLNHFCVEDLYRHRRVVEFCFDKLDSGGSLLELVACVARCLLAGIVPYMDASHLLKNSG